MPYYFSVNTEDLLYPNGFTEKEKTLSEGYKYLAFIDKDVPIEIKKQWQELNKRAWDLRPNAYIMFVFYGDKLVSTFYVTSKGSVGTCHSARTSEDHRRRGFYKYFVFRGIEILLDRNITRVDIETGQKYLWPFWYRLGLKRVDTIDKIAKSFR